MNRYKYKPIMTLVLSTLLFLIAMFFGSIVHGNYIKKDLAETGYAVYESSPTTGDYKWRMLTHGEITERWNGESEKKKKKKNEGGMR